MIAVIMLVGIVRVAGICGRRGGVGFSMTKEMFDRTEPRRGNPNQQRQRRANAEHRRESALLRTNHVKLRPRHNAKTDAWRQSSCQRKTALQLIRRGEANPSKIFQLPRRIQDQTPERAKDLI